MHENMYKCYIENHSYHRKGVLVIYILLIIIAMILFGFVIFIHEFGHFISAKIMGVRVNEFAIGMGPALLAFQKRETKYALRLFPIGGYCAMEGEDQESKDPSAFGNKAVWKRMIIVAAGAFMNVLLGFLFMLILLSQQDGFASTTISKFSKDAVSNQYGLQIGDRIESINGYHIDTDKDLTFALSTSKDVSLDITVQRNGTYIELHNVTFASQKLENGTEIIALDFFVDKIEKNIITLFSQSFKSTISVVRITWASLVGLLKGSFGFHDIAGPVGMVSVVGQAASIGLSESFLRAMNNVIMVMTIITINLGIMNLLPLPALDGGRLVFLIIEGIRRKPINPKYEGWIHATGLVLFLLLMLLITFSDVAKLFTGKGF